MATVARRPASWENPPRWSALIALPWLMLLALSATQAHAARVIAARERTTLGTITGHDPGNHDSYQYAYEVGGRTLRAWQIPSGDDDWRMGEQVVVYYDPEEPTESSLVEFSESGDRASRPVPALVVGITGIFAFIYIQRRRARRANVVDDPAKKDSLPSWLTWR